MYLEKWGHLGCSEACRSWLGTAANCYYTDFFIKNRDCFNWIKAQQETNLGEVWKKIPEVSGQE